MVAVTTMMMTNMAAEAVEVAWPLGPKLHRTAIGYTSTSHKNQPERAHHSLHPLNAVEIAPQRRRPSSEPRRPLVGGDTTGC